jgi:hypothetical protein
VAESIKRSAMHVSKRLRVFDDELLAPPVLADQLPVSTAEELLRAPEDERPQLVEQAVAERWSPADARRAVVERKVTLQTGPQRSRRVLKLVAELRQLLDIAPPADLSDEARTALAQLVDATRRSQRDHDRTDLNILGPTS